MKLERRNVFDETAPSGAATGLVERLCVAIGDKRIGKNSAVHVVPVGAEFLREIVHDVEEDDLHIPARIVGIFEDLRFGARTNLRKGCLRKDFLHSLGREEMFRVVDGHSHEIGERVRRIMHVRGDGKEFRTVEEDDIGKIFLDILRRAGEYRRFDDGNLPLPHKLQHAPYDGIVESIGSRRCPHGDEHDIAIFYFVLVADIFLLKRIPHHGIAALFKVVRVCPAYPPLSDEADQRLIFSHMRDCSSYSLRMHAAISSQYARTYPSKSAYG